MNNSSTFAVYREREKIASGIKGMAMLKAIKKDALQQKSKGLTPTYTVIEKPRAMIGGARRKRTAHLFNCELRWRIPEKRKKSSRTSGGN